MESGGEAVDDHGPGWVPVKKKHRSGSKFSVRSWAGGFSGTNGSSHQLPIASVSAKFAKFAGKHKPHISKGDSKNSKSVPDEGDNSKATTNISASLSKSKNSSSPPKPPVSNVSSNIPVSDGNRELPQKDEPERVPKIKWSDFDDDDVSSLYPGTMHEGSVRSYGSKNISLVDFDNENRSHLTSSSFTCSDLQESKSAVTAITVDSYPSLASKEDKFEDNSDESSTVSLPEVDAPIMDSHHIASDNVSDSGKTCELRHDCSKIGVPPCEETDMGVQVPKLVHDSGIQGVPEIGEVPALNSSFSFGTRNKCESSVDGDTPPFNPDPRELNMSELSTSPVEKLSDSEMPLEGSTPLTSESPEDYVSDASSPPVEKLSVVVTCQSPFVSEGNKQAVFDSSVTTEKTGMVAPHQLPLDVSGAAVERLVVERQSPFVSEGNNIDVSESLATKQESGMVIELHVPLVSEGDESLVSDELLTTDTSGMVADPELPVISEGNKSSMLDPPVAIGKSVFIDEARPTLVSEGNESSTSVSPVTVIEPELLTTKGNESTGSLSPMNVGELSAVVESQVPDISKGNGPQVVESPFRNEKSGTVVEPSLPLMTEVKDLRVSEWPVRTKKPDDVVEPSLPLITEEKDSRVSESPVTMKKPDDVVISPLLLTSEAVNRVSDSSVALEKSETLVEPLSPLVSEENESGVSDSSATTEKAELGESSLIAEKLDSKDPIDSSSPLVSEDNESRFSESSATTEKAKLTESPLIAKELDSRDPVEPPLPLVFQENESRVSASSATTEKAELAESPFITEELDSRDPVEPLSHLISEENESGVSESSATTGKAELAESPLIAEKCDSRDPVESPSPLVSEDNESRFSESSATTEKAKLAESPLIAEELDSRDPVELPSPLVSEENESRVSASSATTEKAELAELPLITEELDSRDPVEPLAPLISEENESEVPESSATTEKAELAESPLIAEKLDSKDPVESPSPLVSEDNESGFSESSAATEKAKLTESPLIAEELDSRDPVEAPLPLVSQENESRVSASSATTEKAELAESPFITEELDSRDPVEPLSPLISEENESGVPESSAATEKAELAESPLIAEKRDSKDPVESPSPLVSEDNESRFSESSATTEKAKLTESPLIAEELDSRDPVEPPSPLVSQENESRVSASSATTEKAELAESPFITEELDSRDPVEPLSPLISEENESGVSESSAATEKAELAESPLIAEKRDSRDPVESQSPLVSEDNESRFSESSATTEKAKLAESPLIAEELDSRDPVEPPSPLVSEENESRVSDSSATTEKAELTESPLITEELDSRDPVEPLSPLISEENEGVSESSATTEKSELAALTLIAKEYNSRHPVERLSPLVSEENVSRVSELLPKSQKKAELAESPFIAEELDFRDPESPVATGKSDIAAETKFSIICREKELRASEVPVTTEKSEIVAEPLLPQSSKVNEPRVSDSPLILEKDNLLVETQLPLISKENDAGVSLPVTTDMLDTVVESQLPCASEESELTVSMSAVTNIKSDTLVDAQFLHISGVNEWRESESPVKVEKSDVAAESQLPLFSEENKLRVAELPVTFEKSDIVIESHMPSISNKYQPRTLESPFKVEKSETGFDSQLPVMSEENELKVSESPDKRYDSHISLVSDENELRAPPTHVVGEKLNMVDSQLPTISKENKFSISGSPVTVGKSDSDAESQLPMISTENESRICEPCSTPEKSDAVIELLPLCSKDESRVSERTLPVLSEERESRVSELPVKKSVMVVGVQTSPLTYEGDESRVSKLQTKTSGVMVEPRVIINCKEKEAKVSDPPVRMEISGTTVEPQSHQLPLGYENIQSGASEPPLKIEKSAPIATQIKTESVLQKNRESVVPGESSAVAKIHFPAIPEESESSISEVSSLNQFSMIQDSNSTTPEDNSHDIPTTSSQITSVGNNEASFGRPLCDGLQKVHKQDDPTEGDVGESKERFRERLWCFLFENLNRSVDELYLLSELECDIDQMKEAVLVLEEAASDFNELATRVQEFDKVKRSPQSIDGAMSTLKSDHRRPHALSWEVRRMSTSPNRADILSSSLEAFKKIQQERADMLEAYNSKNLVHGCSTHHVESKDLHKLDGESLLASSAGNSVMGLELGSPCLEDQKQIGESGCCSEVDFIQNGDDCLQSVSGVKKSRVHTKEISTTVSEAGESKRVHELENLIPRKAKSCTGNISMRTVEINDQVKKQAYPSEKDKEKRNSGPFKSMDAWKERRNWAEILSTPSRTSSRISHLPGLNSKSAERARVLHDKLMSPEKKKKNALDLKKEAEEKHARARRIRNELENERVLRLQRTSEKLNRMNEWQAVRTMKLREGMHARHQRSESRHEAYLAQVARRAGDESSKVNEVRFITSMNEENKKLMLRQKLHDSELRRAEKLEVKKFKQKEDMAREEAVLERRKLIEAEKLQRLAEIQRRKEEAQIRREVERKASSAAREARAMEQLRKREERAKAQQEEAEMLAQKLAERLRESEQRRKFYLEQIRERASMDFRDQSSPLLRRSVSRDGQGRSTVTSSSEDCQEQSPAGPGSSGLAPGNTTQQNSLKRQIKKIRQRLMALKYEFIEPPVSCETSSFAYRTAVGTARVKIGRWIQELQRFRQARKEGASSIGLTTAGMIKYLEGRDPELQASRQAGLLDFIASALPASHTSKPEACQVTVHFLKLLRVVLSMSTNRSYFLAQNLLPPIVPMLSAALENYIKMAASPNAPGCATVSSGKPSIEIVGSGSEVLENFLWIVGAIIGHTGSDERENQMQDGLIELLTAYRVIHRLRDLFVLYDRPQVEGLPFPSSILLGVHLLVVLTYKARSNSSIDLESSPIEMMLNFDGQEGKSAENSKFANSSNGISACERSSLSERHGSRGLTSPDPPVDGLCSIAKGDEPASVVKDGETSQTRCSVELNGGCTKLANDQILTEEKCVKQSDSAGLEQKNHNLLSRKQPVADLLSAISETGLVSLPSLITSVLLQTSPRPFSEQGSYILPSNFEEVATGVLKVVNNLALLDVSFIQRMLATPDLKMEFFHLMSFLLSHCTSKWRGATDQIGLLLLEALLLLGHFALLHPENQAVLRWGKSPTILHKVCDLPFAFFSDPNLMPILAGTLVAACYACEQNKSVVQQELCVDMLLSLLKSCRKSNPTAENPPAEDCSGSNQHAFEFKKSLADNPLKPIRNYVRPGRYSLGSSVSSIRSGKPRSQRDVRPAKSIGGEELGLKQSLGAPEASAMLHCRFSSAFIDRAEQFLSSENGDV